ncbi:MAG: hypothetical protein ACR2K5_15390 [Pseudolabrys sp.]
MPANVFVPRGSTRPLLFVAVGLGAAVAATGSLWAYYGSTVFFEMVRAGWIACF